ncbi:hypothetical protein Ahy_A09g042435 isoform C [Arachis hypogaea]|uniref:Alpha-D-phosphohexomutase alpha/beta/alpha domain-containing protein n=1 Tax=Arachis hypogaea TaxID=3818 RepID=A0A445BG12_ARAHY|nr:hypothetical protein Ahy_A09g042435 isoform C [Arachis hypogaea]
MQENYLANWIQALFDSLPPEDNKNGVLVLGAIKFNFVKKSAYPVSDFCCCSHSLQIIIKIASGNGVEKILVGQQASFNHLIFSMNFSTTNVKNFANGGFIMSASYNPGGPEYDWFNYSSGQPAPESITDKIYGNTLSISEIKIADIPDVDLSKTGVTKFGSFSVEVIDPVSDYLELLETVFDFQLIRSLISRPDFRFTFDAMHAVTGAMPNLFLLINLVQLWILGFNYAMYDSIANGIPLEDFGHGHPDPNLTYAKDLVNILYAENGPDFGAASDGDGNRNMILGRCFFVTPSDSVAVIAANAREAIPYFKDGVKGLARSMPTSGALMSPLVGNFLGILWMLGSYQFAGKRVLEQALTTFVRRMASAWLSIIAHRNKDKKAGEKLISVADVVKEHWATYGRNFFSRYDYEECESEGANKMVAYLRETASKSKTGDKYGSYVLQFADDFTYTDPVDGSVVSKQGVRFVFSDGSRIIYRLSGTGSAGATVRVYIEQFEPDASKHDLDAQVALKPLINLALSLSKLKDFTGREKPTVIT